MEDKQPLQARGPKFVIIYQRGDDKVETKTVGDTTIIAGGKWLVDTVNSDDENDGSIDTYDDLEIALSRVMDIRKKGGEACLAVVIE